ncbi:unnamed protein product [Prorocentrum cordatum]|uniref:Uncharacterized protein n=1 Tax=Prorocentrum cordatum TaxID=2364126 RepID=A0ABN9U147_9DINO|nr:unnamed protein product [Polarella glacialis]
MPADSGSQSAGEAAGDQEGVNGHGSQDAAGDAQCVRPPRAHGCRRDPATDQFGGTDPVDKPSTPPRTTSAAAADGPQDDAAAGASSKGTSDLRGSGWSWQPELGNVSVERDVGAVGEGT